METYEEVGIFIISWLCLGLVISFGYCVYVIYLSSQDSVKRKYLRKSHAKCSSKSLNKDSSSASAIVIIDPDYLKPRIDSEKRSKESVAGVHESSCSSNSSKKTSSLLEKTSKNLNQPPQTKLNRISETSSLSQDLDSENTSKVNQETLSHYEEYKSLNKIEDLRADPSKEQTSVTNSENVHKTEKDSLSHFEEYKSTNKIEDLRTDDPSNTETSEEVSWMDKLTKDNKYGLHPPLDLTQSSEKAPTKS